MSSSHRPTPTRRNSTIELSRVGRCELAISLRQAVSRVSRTLEKEVGPLLVICLWSILLLYVGLMIVMYAGYTAGMIHEATD